MTTILPQNVELVRELDLSKVKPGTIERFWVQISTSGIGSPLAAPIMIARGKKDGPVVGITAAIHGNELNGIRVIQRVFKNLDLETLSGTVVGVLVMNVPGFLAGQRKFNDGIDLNHIMPGKQGGNTSNVYAFRLVDRLVRHFNYLVDLHTASFGRVNSYYVRADMNDEETGQMARLQNADIIVNNPPMDGTLRGAAANLGIHAITLELGNPHRFQKGLIQSGLDGINNLLIKLGMKEGALDVPDEEPYLCSDSYWMYTQIGGILSVLPDLGQEFKKGEIVARIMNIFGDRLQEYEAPEDGIVIGKSVNPVNQTGGRILHLGIPK